MHTKGGFIKIFRERWSIYAIEALGLGLFMISACVFATLLEHPASGIHRFFPSPMIRRILMGCAMGLTAISLIYSKWGQKSGAHLNPSVSLTFFRLRKMHKEDLLFYMLAQFVGGVIGIAAASIFIGSYLVSPNVNYVATLPGMSGIGTAFFAEFLITFILMSVILQVSNQNALARFTGVFAGVMVALFITFEAPVSGMSMNPARSFASTVFSGSWKTLWIYFTAPVLGMLAAAEVYLRLRGWASLVCAKLYHPKTGPCHFFCGRGNLRGFILKEEAHHVCR